VRVGGEPDETGSRKLEWFSSAVSKACERDGDLATDAMRATGLQLDDFVAAKRLIRRRRVESVMVPGMSLEARREAAADEAINGQIGKLVTAVSVMQELFDSTGAALDITTCGVSRQITAHRPFGLLDAPFLNRAIFPCISR
jgi:hypothetical protein